MKLIAIAAAAMLGLTACSGIPVATVTVTQETERTKTAEPNLPRGNSSGDRIVDLLERTDPAFGRVNQDTLVELAQMVCDRLDDGYAASALGSIAMDSGFTQNQAAALIAASIVVYCPWQEDNVR